MHRRSLLKTAAALPWVMALGGGAALAQAREEQAAKWRAEAFEAFPYEVEEVRGSEALDRWSELKATGKASPVIVGGEQAFNHLLDNFHPNAWQHAEEPVLEEALEKAVELTHPEDLNAYLQAEEARAIASLRESGITLEPASEPPVGDWPEAELTATGPTVTMDFRSGQALERVFIVKVPTDDWTTIPTHLRWGGWNSNPPPEFHVAALRSWSDRYGAELVGLSSDTMNLRVAMRPQTREEALALAREQYAYCNDLVDQGYGTLSSLAAFLKADPWWWFWWD